MNAPLNERLPYTAAFPHALGTGLIVQSAAGIDSNRRAAITAFIEEYEAALSRFRGDSLVAAMAGSSNGGTFDFPDWAGPLFDLYDALAEATDGAIDPCVGEDLIRLGYDARYSFRLSADAVTHAAEGPTTGGSAAAGWNLGAVHGRATWRDDVGRRGPDGTTLVTTRPVSLDFGACGKGYLVDLLAWRFLADAPAYVIDAGGDLLVHMSDGDVDGCVIDTASQAGGLAVPLPDTAPSRARDGASTSFDGVRDGAGRWHGDPDPDALHAAANSSPTSNQAPLTIAMEDPDDTANAVGVASVAGGAFCASAPSRRHWGEAAGLRLHHLLNAVDGLPVRDVAATWVTAPHATATRGGKPASAGAWRASHPGSANHAPTDHQAGAGIADTAKPLGDSGFGNHAGSDASRGNPAGSVRSASRGLYPTALADGLATACFVAAPDTLAKRFDFECAILYADRSAAVSAGFPGRLFMR
ncbi:FAD:protein FMN transferase [Bifidobacterium leontopitheci]|uniref:Thiamine biosynthesis protein ApbE n=1 Tax=Bifidobacterium leontopitheci TaxID=2650774 RepID=A0A6I1GG37_9BIFI|nr:FAD:protein FMN transferase [Bifidobacterium leontopitheci]KAB7790604.1 thiamine biosynthesis protein ApbE [Bifidobacterium leontopitheci]